MIDNTDAIPNPRQQAAAARAILSRLDEDDWMWFSRRYLRRAIRSGHRGYFDDALGHLVEAGMIEQRGNSYRLAPSSGYRYLEGLVAA